jgi:hypothetical protein
MRMAGLGVASGLILGTCAVFGQGPRLPEEKSEVATPVFTAVAELKSGDEREGAIAIVDGALVITPEGGVALTTRLDELATLKVTVRNHRSRKVSETVLTGALPSPWRSRDLGRMVVPGKARWKDDQFIVAASPRVEDERFDAFHLVYLPIVGDGEIVARVVKLDNEDEDSYGGIVMCDGLTPENRKALLGVHPYGEKGVSFRRWGYQGGSSTGKEIPSLQLPYWVKLVREGYDVKAYYSPDGRRWRFLKVSPGKMRDEQIYVGLAVRVQKFNRLSETIIDHVSVNGVGSTEAEPMLPSIVLRSGSRLAADIVKANSTAFHLSGRWKGTALTTPKIARVEFFHPLPGDLQRLVQGERAGLLLRSGDFSEGAFDSLGGGKLRISSVLLGMKEHSILDDADALVLRKVVEVEAAWRVETQAGSILLAQKASLTGEQLVLDVAGLGEVHFRLEEIASLDRVAAN